MASNSSFSRDRNLSCRNFNKSSSPLTQLRRFRRESSSSIESYSTTPQSESPTHSNSESVLEENVDPSFHLSVKQLRLHFESLIIDERNLLKTSRSRSSSQPVLPKLKKYSLFQNKTEEYFSDQRNNDKDGEEILIDATITERNSCNNENIEKQSVIGLNCQISIPEIIVEEAKTTNGENGTEEEYDSSQSDESNRYPINTSKNDFQR